MWHIKIIIFLINFHSLSAYNKIMIETWILEWKKKTIFQNSQRIIYVEKISAKTDDQRQNIYTCVEHVGEANQASKQEKTETYFGSKIK